MKKAFILCALLLTSTLAVGADIYPGAAALFIDTIGSSMPEPTTFLMLGSGLIGLVMARKNQAS